ncbi:MAG TPA: glycosyltransferase [Polyangiales bacterium]|nr:glycosyltransferase [Polyangiales bacterium]
MSIPTGIFLQLLAFLLLCSWSALSVVALLKLRRRKLTAPPRFDGVSVLKPLSGVDPALEANLRSFFDQDHPVYEIVFGVQNEADPALVLARRLKRQYPHVPCRIVVHDRTGMNPKISNLRAMLQAVQHDWVVISDANVRVGRQWLRELACVAHEPRTGLVFNPIAGDMGRNLGTQLETLQLDTCVAAGCSVPTELLGHPAVIGKSMLFRRSLFEALGGFESVASVLAEDYVMGRMFGTAGYRVRIAPTPARNVQAVSLRQFLARQLRWATLRCRLQPLAYAAEPLFGPLPLFVFGWLSGQLYLPLAAAAVAICVLRDALLLLLMRTDAGGPPRIGFSLLLLGGLRELLMFGVWAVAPFVRHVSWRGHRLRLSAGTRLYAEQPLLQGSSYRVE